MTTPGRSIRAERVDATRNALLSAAERLFAEQGLFAVSNRQISDAAGQGNNAAVGYHFGSRPDLIRAIVRRHGEGIGRLRREWVAAAAASTDVRDWVSCLVRPSTDYLAGLGHPTYFGRFGAQVLVDPAYREIMIEGAFADPAVQRILDGLNRCRPDMPITLCLERNYMARQLLIQTIAERERLLAEGAGEGRSEAHSGWQATGTRLIDAISAVWMAPATPSP
jgi:AcrR family transcriptional regulator